MTIFSEIFFRKIASIYLIKLFNLNLINPTFCKSTLLAIITSISVISSNAQNLNLNSKIFSDNIINMSVSDSTCSQHIPFINKDGGRIYLAGIKSCNGSEKMKGELTLILQKGTQTFYSSYNNIESYYFPFSKEDILSFFKKLSLDERKSFYLSTKEECRNYYEILRKEFLAEIEKTRIEELQKLELKQQEREVQLMAELREEEKADSIFSLKSHNKLIEQEDSYNELVENFKTIIDEGAKLGGILVHKFDISGSYSTNVSIGILNCLNKRIKYAEFTLKATNPVHDPVGMPQTVKGIGFIEAKSFGEWDFENIWFSDIIKYVKIASIKLTYEDGSIRNITNPNTVIKIFDGDLSIEVESLLKSKNYKSTIIGPVQLIDGEIDLVIFYPSRSEEISTIVVNNFFIENLEKTISEIGIIDEPTNGNLSCKKQSSNIYLYSDEERKTGEYIMLSINDAKLLLESIKK